MDDIEATSGIENQPAQGAADTDSSVQKQSDLSNIEGETTETSEASEKADLNQDHEGQDDDQADSAEHQDGSEKQNKKNGFKKRIERFQRQIQERDQEIARLRAQGESGSGKQESTQEPKKANGNGEPNKDDFETVGDYNKALVKWEFEQFKAEQGESERKAKEAESRQKLQSNYDSKLSEFKKAAPDFDEVISNFAESYPDFEIHPAVLAEVQQSPVGPEIFYEIAKTEGLYDRLKTMSPQGVLKEIGKLEARIEFAKESKTQKQPTTIQKSKAPPPARPVSTAATKTEKSYADMSFDEYMEARNAEKRRK